MDTPDPTLTDPAALLDTLDAGAIEARLEMLDREARALRVLLRSARARQRAPREEGDRGD
jgi:hypothetical protein